MQIPVRHLSLPESQERKKCLSFRGVITILSPIHVIKKIFKDLFYFLKNQEWKDWICKPLP